MKLDLKSTSRSLRLATILIGICLILWLPIEEKSTNGVKLFAGLLSALAFAHLLNLWDAKRRIRFYTYPILGFITGLVLAPLAVGLMAFKVGLHAHPTPDFSPQQVMGVLATTPIWVTAGVLIGLGAGLWQQYGAGR